MKTEKTTAQEIMDAHNPVDLAEECHVLRDRALAEAEARAAYIDRRPHGDAGGVARYVFCDDSAILASDGDEIVGVAIGDCCDCIVEAGHTHLCALEID